MPKKRTTRDKYKRKLDQIDGHYDLIVEILSDMFITYHENHPDISLTIAMLLETVSELQKATKRFRDSF